MARLFLIVATPPIVAWVFAETLIREMRSAFWTARNEAAINFDQAKRAWLANSLNLENNDE